MTTSETDFIIFYSWQSDLPNETNRQAIRSALRTASSEVEAKNPNLRVVIDEATREKPGSPNIPLTILEKIKTCDAFVCDITTINKSASPAELRRTPNPNVLFELGYAVAHIGWGRIVMLFNEEFGVFPSDSPFDIDRHRVSKYQLSCANAKSKPDIAKLSALATEAVHAIVSQQPPKPFSSLQQTPDEIKRNRDIRNIKWAMASLHIPTVDDMIEELPRYLGERAHYFLESFNEVISNSLFHVNDEDTKAALLAVHQAWDECVSTGRQYRYPGGAKMNTYIFNPEDGPLDDVQKQAWNAIESARSTLKAALDKLLDIIRQHYLEIDIAEMNDIAWRNYVDLQRR